MNLTILIISQLGMLFGDSVGTSMALFVFS